MPACSKRPAPWHGFCTHEERMSRTFFVRQAQLSTPRSLPLFVLCAAVLACTAETPEDTESANATENGANDTEADDTESDDTESDDTEADETEADDTDGGRGFTGFAMFLSQAPEQQADPTWLADGEELDEDALILVVSSLGPPCELPDTSLPVVNHRVLLVGLPAAAQTVGTYDFASPEIVAWSSHWLGDGMGNGGGGAGPLVEGSVDIVAIDEDAVEIQLPEGGELVGEFVLERCPR